MLDESMVQKLCRIRVHATERVESKRNEEKVVLVTDLSVRLDVVVVEHDWYYNIRKYRVYKYCTTLFTLHPASRSARAIAAPHRLSIRSRPAARTRHHRRACRPRPARRVSHASAQCVRVRSRSP